MKKFVSGMIVGLLMFAGVSVFADSSSLVGRTVSGIFSVVMNGEQLSEAVIIDGKAYAPVRSIAEATGTDIKVKGKRIIIQDKEVQTVSEPTPSNTPTGKDDPWEVKKQQEIQGLLYGIEDRKKEIEKYQEFLMLEKDKLTKAESPQLKENYRASIEMLEINISNAQNSIEEAETRIAELQS
ncbi:hypothetical protein [Paenibacillus dakarensis]|uniref:hypothetical protein n=1 Tax=Paenibacillus dakarensis TaxID=1527293 RepID=UPI0006D53686|nr:hypothetical protein [Paenibacillus dakarensis]